MRWFVQEQTGEHQRFNAGFKARQDLDDIFKQTGANSLIIKVPDYTKWKKSVYNTIRRNLTTYNAWNKAMEQVNPGDVVYIQFSVINYTAFMERVIKKAEARGICMVAFVHDLEHMRNMLVMDSMSAKSKKKMEIEINTLKRFSKVVVHNDKMRNYCVRELGMAEEQLITLELFDYLIPLDRVRQIEKRHYEDYRSVIIAGNLRKDKSGYVYQLPENVRFELYGANYEEKDKVKPHIHFHGAFPPEELPFSLEGGFGLVWDGPSAESCKGVFGNYLRYNNPHKASLYLASGIPVIIWKKAALADYMTKNQCGIVIDSLEDLAEQMQQITKKEYDTLQSNALKISEKLVNGYYTKRAMEQVSGETYS